jgi:hypothetical protein
VKGKPPIKPKKQVRGVFIHFLFSLFIGQNVTKFLSANVLVMLTSSCSSEINQTSSEMKCTYFFSSEIVNISNKLTDKK